MIQAGVQQLQFIFVSVFYFFYLIHSRITLLFFAISGLDLLNHLDDLTDETKKDIIEWIYLQQLHPSSDTSNPTLGKPEITSTTFSSYLYFSDGKFGFRGSPANGSNSTYDYCNLAMTYCALSTLIILGDDLSRVNRAAILRGLKEYQKDDGRYKQLLFTSSDINLIWYLDLFKR